MSLDDLKSRFEHHEKHDDERFLAFQSLSNDLKSDIKFIKENHLNHMEVDIKELSKSQSSIDAHLFWIKWISIAVLGIIISTYFRKPG